MLAADPDAGLLAFRRLSDTLGGTHWVLKMLRDVGGAGQRMAHRPQLRQSNDRSMTFSTSPRMAAWMA